MSQPVTVGVGDLNGYLSLGYLPWHPDGEGR